MNSIKNIIKKILKRPILVIALIATVMGAFTGQNIENPKEIKDISYTKFIEMTQNKKVEKIEIDLNAPVFTFTDKDGEIYSTDNPKDKDFKKNMLEAGIEIEEIDSKEKTKQIMQIIDSLRYILIIGIMIAFLKSSGISTLKKEPEAEKVMPNTTFKDIAGNEEAKEDMRFLVNFLKNPKKFTEMGAKLPKGVIFYGPPGTGKTLTARALAGEAGVPFFSVSGSDFVEMYVGLGAKRMRTLFEKARAAAPCIIFVDEIDAVGSHRGRDNHSEKDQTINAMLKEMDGFKGSEGVLVIAATNRIESLDSALIRPGRFDKKIAINLPDAKDRLEILKVHAKNKKMANDIDFEELSKLTIGFSGAGLEALLNEATILATSNGKKEVSKEDIDTAYSTSVMGAKKKNQEDRNDKELELVAWHEAGHALVSRLITSNDVPKVTIISSTNGTGGATFNIPKKMGLLTKKELMNDIKMTYAGRVAEYLLTEDENEITTGASMDIKQATQRILQLINDFGMSEKYGMIRVSDVLGDKKDEVLSEAILLSKELYQETLELLTENKDKLMQIANELLDKESLNQEDLDRIIFAN